MYKNVRCTCKVVVLPTKPIVVFDVLIAVVSSDCEITRAEQPAEEASCVSAARARSRSLLTCESAREWLRRKGLLSLNPRRK